MELGEAVNCGELDVREENPTCARTRDKTDDHGWKARVNDWGQDAKSCSGTNLYDEATTGLWDRRTEHTKRKCLGVVPKKRGRDHWARNGLAAVGRGSFPVQAHHLIPKNFLPKHHVCVWLCKDWSRNKTYQLVEDAPYNTDHANNGYCMPYASPLKEWKKAKSDDEKRDIAFRVMEKTGVQLHQGSHAAVVDTRKINELLGDGKLPDVKPASGSEDSEELEDGLTHDPGYLNALKRWLGAVHARIQVHVETCTDGCRRESGGKTKVRPLEDTVRLMNRVSYIAKVFLEKHLIFACPYGAAYAASKGLLVWDEATARYHVRKLTRAGTEDLTRQDLETALAQRER